MICFHHLINRYSYHIINKLQITKYFFRHNTCINEYRYVFLLKNDLKKTDLYYDEKLHYIKQIRFDSNYNSKKELNFKINKILTENHEWICEEFKLLES